MATTVTYVGNQYSVPAYNDTGYAQGAGNLSSFLVALATGSLTLSGGSFPLTADANFGTNFGLAALYLKSVTANIATSGILRLAKTDTIAWRNNANSANLALTIDASDRLTYNGAVISAFGIPLPIADGGTNSITALTNGFLMASNAGAIVESAIAISTKALSAITSISSDTANRAAAGVVRLANATDTISWRNAANSADKTLTVNASDQLVYAGTAFLSSAGVVPVTAGGTGLTASPITVALGGTNSTAALNNNRVMKSSSGTIIEAAAITASRAVISDANGIPSTGTNTTNAAGYIIGTVVQSASATSATAFTATGSTYATTNLSVAITPLANTHKIRVTAVGTMLNVNPSAKDIQVSIFRGATDLFPGSGLLQGFAGLGNGGVNVQICVPASGGVLDSPATTSSTTYSVKIRNNGGFADGQWGNEGLQYILVEEYAA